MVQESPECVKDGNTYKFIMFSFHDDETSLGNIYDKKPQDILKILKNETKKRMESMSEYHGWEHTISVSHYARLLALGEGAEMFSCEAAAWTHDWGRAEEQRGENRPHAELSWIVSKHFYAELRRRGRITGTQYKEIQWSIRKHSKVGSTIFITLKVIRDADRLSRFTSLGLYHNLLGLLKEGVPFYIEGRPIIRPKSAEVMTKKEVSCAVDDLNFVSDFRKIFETNTAKEFMSRMKDVHLLFVRLFSNHVDIKDGALWLAYLREYALDFKRKKDEFENCFSWTNSRQDIDAWLDFYASAESPDILSEASFQKFLKKKDKIIR